MTEIPKRPPPGWYADPELPGELRYWDGEAWGERFHSSGSSKHREPRPVGPGFATLARWLGILLGLTMVGMVGQLCLYTWGFVMFEDAAEEGDLNRINTFDSIDAGILLALLIALVVGGIVWMVWQYRLARFAHAGALRRGPGMHAFSWIIPVVSIWFPYQNVKDLWTLNVGGRPPAFLGWWWAGWIAGLVLDRVVTGSTPDSVAGFKTLMIVEIVTALVGLATTMLSLRIVRTLTAAGLRRAAAEAAAAGRAVG